MRRTAILTCLALAVTALVLCPSLGMTADFTLYTLDGYNKLDTVAGGWGGEFQVYTSWPGYANAGGHKYGYPSGMQFATFCVEIDEHLQHGVTYAVDLSDPPVQVPGAVAWLYDRWYTGNLKGTSDNTGYRYTETGTGVGDESSGRANDAYELQRMLWKYMPDYRFAGMSFTGKYAEWDAQAYLHRNDTVSDVHFMKLTENGAARQDLLVLVKKTPMNTPISEPATLALLACGALPLLRRRRAT